MAGVWAMEESRQSPVAKPEHLRKKPSVKVAPVKKAGPRDREEAEEILLRALGVGSTVDVIPAGTTIKAKYLFWPDSEVLGAALDMLGYERAEDGSYRR